MTCERCGKVIVAPIEYGDFFICKECNYEDNFKSDRFPYYNKHDETLEKYKRMTSDNKKDLYIRQSFRLKNFH
ncbi:hypothetical protein [uncultured Clostridium sp.]|uniref:hypothetical protein n=1 Tax=uncultured Clostridium sp. TaxID=59620 RepID=UPI002638625C|nr:hypothetical protein [uncultured Clostridium sp.]